VSRTVNWSPSRRDRRRELDLQRRGAELKALQRLGDHHRHILFGGRDVELAGLHAHDVEQIPDQAVHLPGQAANALAFAVRAPGRRSVVR
jgi:hypothetical protein